MEALRKVVNTKWAATAASIWIQTTSGNLYTFSIYSQALKSTQGYSQSTLDTISVSKDVGANCGILSGVLYSAAVSTGGRWMRRFSGPWVVHLAGAAQSFAGYFLIWASVVGLIPRPPVVVMCLFMFVAAHAQSFFNTADVVTAVRNFPGYSGTAVGIMKGYIGLSGAILIQAYRTIFNNKPTAFLLMLALLPTINSMLLMWFVRVHESAEGDDLKRLNTFSAISMIIAAYLMVIIVLEEVLSLHFILRTIAFFLLLLLLASPLYVAIKAAGGEDPRQQKLAGEHSDVSGLEYHIVPGDGDQEDSAQEKAVLGSGEDRDLLQAVRTVDFWLLFLAMACGMGSGLATVNNLSQIGRSLGYKSYEISTMISLWSIWNFLGRFGAGYVSDILLRAQGWARPLFMALTLLALSIGHLVISSGLRGSLYGGTVVVGIAYGSQWSLMPTISSEIFGVEHMGTIFNTITMANPVGSYLFSVRVIGYIYDREASGEGFKCKGTHCFSLSFIIMASATLVGSLAALWLFFRTRDFYNQVIRRRLQG
ncbi:protein NUCLEAR FUSION DEFECTIVE 4-like [Punica granatum]|uniref:Uncharacterized protein n=2 Tax=Punica granatum TaxID=22663 RepID=A0A218XZT7_PUNGR|nr:protein NUCLEAR FUSION DEFECTIVE 4-like [Punica granatum]OWM90454.1 hypothetical protein CDL15_Pgr014757 [Punica granatum]PKI78035.1 hypothetical protein CRG98_001655 [Punica granatum]